MKSFLDKIDPSLYNLTKSQSTRNNEFDCIVYYNSLTNIKNYINYTNCCKVVNEYPFINALGVKISSENIDNFARHKNLNYITSVAKVQTQVNVSKKVSNIDALYKQGLSGKNVTVAIIDTGISPHLDFVYPTNRILAFKDFKSSKKYPYDDNGHGTFIASVLCGNGMISGGEYSGIAPNSNIISLKALDEKGETGALTILEAMQWVFDNKEKYNIKIVCMSFGSNPLGSSDPLKLGAETLWDNGIMVIAAAGNSGPNASTIKSPGISSKIITVGALDDGREDFENIDRQNFSVADFSSRGPAYRFYKPDIIASGVGIVGASNGLDSRYTKMSGTSVATPIVAGVCALFLEKYNKATPSQIKGLLLNNAIPLTRNRNLEGYGYLYIK